MFCSLISCSRNGFYTEINYSGTSVNYNRNNGKIDTSVTAVSITFKTSKDSVIFESSNTSFNDRFKKNKDNVYEYTYYSRDSRKYKFSGDSLYVTYGYSNPTTLISWGNFAGLKK